MIEVVGEKVGEKAIKAKQAGRRSALIERGEGGGGVGGKDGVLGSGPVRFPCPAGPWGLAAADVTSGAPPLSLHLHHFPSLWSGVQQPVTSWLVCKGRRRNAPIHHAALPCVQK